MNLFKRYKTEKAEAKRILEGVIAISEAEQLIHGQYITDDIVKPELRKTNICGGRQACLIGSVALAAVPRGRKPSVDKIIDAIRYDEDRYADFDYYASRMLPKLKWARRQYPGALRAMDALNAEAQAKLVGKRGQRAADARQSENHNTAESYFEVYLAGRSQQETHAAIVKLCDGARERI